MSAQGPNILTTKARRRTAAVPQGRIARLVRLGLAAGEMAVGGAFEGLRRMTDASQPASGPSSVFLTPGNARRLAQRLAHLRGAAMKIGQLLSLESGDFVPGPFAEALAILRASATPMPLRQLRGVLGREWGKGWEGRFAAFEEEPVAAASIGQVHRARTRDGRDLALKIQYPGIARSIDSDVDHAMKLVKLARLLPGGYDLDPIVGEAKRQLHQEADYLAEAGFLTRYRRLMGGEPGVLVPRVHPDLTTKRILAMDYVGGEPLAALAGADVSQHSRDEIGTRIERLLFRELFELGFMQTDPNFANYLWQRRTNRLVLLDFGSTREFPKAMVEKFRSACRAIVERDRNGIRDGAFAIGYLAPDDSPAMIEAAIDVIQLICEPLVHRGPYDFAASDLPSRAAAQGMELIFKQGLIRPPPPETTFLHRKLAGAFFLCAHIRARVDVNALIGPFVAPPRAPATLRG